MIDPGVLSASQALWSGQAGQAPESEMCLCLPAGGGAGVANKSPVHAGLGGPRVQCGPAASGSRNRGTPACASGESQRMHQS